MRLASRPSDRIAPSGLEPDIQASEARRAILPWSSSLGWSRTTAIRIRSPDTDYAPGEGEPVAGIEPAPPRWQRGVQPLGPHGLEEGMAGLEPAPPAWKAGMQACNTSSPYTPSRNRTQRGEVWSPACAQRTTHSASGGVRTLTTSRPSASQTDASTVSATDAWPPRGSNHPDLRGSKPRVLPTKLEGTDGVGFEPTTTWFRAKRSPVELPVSRVSRSRTDAPVVPNHVLWPLSYHSKVKGVGVEPTCTRWPRLYRPLPHRRGIPSRYPLTVSIRLLRFERPRS